MVIKYKKIITLLDATSSNSHTFAVVVGVLDVGRAVAWIVRAHGLGPAPYSAELADETVKVPELTH